MCVDIPTELISLICDYGYSLSFRTLNKKYHKQKTQELQEKYKKQFTQINYLKSVLVHTNLNALRVYFPPKKDSTNTREKYAFQQCDGYTEKGSRCKRMCKVSLIKKEVTTSPYIFCHDHKFYANKLVYNNAPPSMIHYLRSQQYASVKKQLSSKLNLWEDLFHEKSHTMVLITKDRKDGTYTINCPNVQVGDKLWHYTNRYIVIYTENNNAQIRAYIPNFT